MREHHRHRRAGEVTLQDFLLLTLVLVCMVGGFAKGLQMGTAFGLPGQLIGGIVGLLAGAAAALLTVLAISLVCEPLDRVWCWWRPYPPVCENGTCLGHDYKLHELPADVVRRVEGLSWLGRRCHCGHVYAGGFDGPMRNRWVRVLPDGQIRPYLRHRTFGRWRPDDGEGIVLRDAEPEGQTARRIPGWIIPSAMAAICGVMALFVVYFEADRQIPPPGYWFAAACALLGVLSGCVAQWLSP